MNDIHEKGGTAVDDSRRDFLKKAAIVAWSAPVIMTVTANRASATHGACLHPGTNCSLTATTAASQCCTSETLTGGTATGLVCCPVGTVNAGKCGQPSVLNTPGNFCTTNAQCCSNRCNLSNNRCQEPQ